MKTKVKRAHTPKEPTAPAPSSPMLAVEPPATAIKPAEPETGIMTELRGAFEFAPPVTLEDLASVQSTIKAAIPGALVEVRTLRGGDVEARIDGPEPGRKRTLVWCVRAP